MEEGREKPNAETGFANTLELTLQRIGAAGYKVTVARRAVVELILRRANYFTAAEIWGDLKQTAPGTGRATVFRTLDLLSELEVLEKIHLSDGCHRYLVCLNQQHYHLICSSCGTSTNFTESSLTKLLQELAKRAQFEIHNHRLDMFGVCQQCQQAQNSLLPAVSRQN